MFFITGVASSAFARSRSSSPEISLARSRVRGRLAPPQAGGYHRDEAGRVGSFGLEVVREIGVEGDAVPLVKLGAPALEDQRQVAGEDDRGLATARLVHRRVGGAA